MSDNSAQKLDKHIPIGRRIGEIMDEKGAAFSIRAFSTRVGMSKDMLGRMISGERYINSSELEIIAKGLSLTVARIKQDDTAREVSELLSLLDNKKDASRSLALAQKINSVSCGITERCDSALNLARAHSSLGDYHTAHELLLQAYKMSEQIFDKYNETDRMYNILSKLMITFTIRKEFSNLSEVLNKVETVFESLPDKMGAICFSKAMIAEHFGNIEQVRSNLTKSLQYFEMTGKQNDIGRAEMSLGYFEFKQKNYLESKALLEKAVVNLNDDIHFRYISIKEYIKALLKIGAMEDAIDLIEKSLPELNSNPSLRAKFNILHSIATNDMSYAEMVFSIRNVESKVLKLACKLLQNHYMKLGDSEAVLKYAVLTEKFSTSQYDTLHEEDL